MKKNNKMHRYNVSMLEKESIITLCENRGYKIKRGTGKNIFIYCPLHEKNLENSNHPITNCVVSEDESFCFCYVCNKKWDVIHYIQEKEDLNFPSALYKVWESVGYQKAYIQNSNISAEEIEEMNKRNKELSKQKAVLGMAVDEKMISKNEEKSMIQAKCFFLSKRFSELEEKFGKDYFSEEKEIIENIQKKKRLG